MGNHEIGEITYYVQYVLIVTLIMTNFSEIILLIKSTINSLVRFHKQPASNTTCTNDKHAET